MTERERPKGVLRVGDRVRFEGRVHTVVGLSGTTVRLVDEHNTASRVMFAHLMASDGFELLDSTAPTPGLPRVRGARPRRRRAGFLQLAKVPW